MATSGQVVIRDDYFYCSICLEIYDTPRTLPCLHSFCQECLKGYILKIKEKSGTQQLFCPVCRADTKTDNVEFKQVEKWVEYFPINFTVLSILKERKLTMMNRNGNYCEACLKEDIKVGASVNCFDCSKKLCEDCRTCHNKNTLFSKHTLISISDQPDSKHEVPAFEYLAKLSKCQSHGTKEVKYLCIDHDQLCCSECAIVSHRKCEDIVSLEEAVKRDTKSDVQERLDVVESKVEKLIRHEATYLANIEGKENEIRGCLKDLKAKLDAAYNNLEMRIMLEMSERKEALAKGSTLQTETAEKLKEDVKEAGQKIKMAKTMGTNLDMFLMKREMSNKVTMYEKACEVLSQQPSKALISLSEVSALPEAIRKIEDLYMIEEVYDETRLSSFTRAKYFENRKLTLEREIRLNHSQPRYCTWVENKIVISVESSSELVAYNADNGSLLSTYKCSAPTSVIATENGEFAVALPSSNKVHILKIEQNQIVCIKKLECLGLDLIAYNDRDKHLLTLSKSEMLLRKITLDGEDVGCIFLTGNVRNHLKFTLNIFVDSQNGHIFISSHGKRMLLCIDMSGNKIFEHEIDNPWSVITDSQGNVYVASYSKDFIQKLGPDGKLLTADLLEDDKIVSPMAMAFSKDMNKMVVTCYRELGQMRIYKAE